MLKAESRCPGGGDDGGGWGVPRYYALTACGTGMLVSDGASEEHRTRCCSPCAQEGAQNVEEEKRRRKGEREEDRATTAWCKGCIGVMQGRPIGGLTAEGDLLGFYVIGSRRFRHAGSALAVLLRSTNSHTKHASFHFSA